MEAAVSGKGIEGSSEVRGGCAYLVLSHKNPSQVESLAQRILALSPTASVVIHHDRTGGPPPWDGREPPARVQFVERTAVEWGGWSIVEATVRLLRFAQEELDHEWVVIVSGEHWPVTDLASWEAELVASGADARMPAEELPRRLRFGRRDADANRDLARCRLRWFRVARPRWAPAHKALAGLSKLSTLSHPVCKLEFSQRNDSWFVGVPRRRGAVTGWTLFKGSEWFACNRRAAAAVLQADERVASWFRRSHIPDESYFQSLLHRDGRLRIDHRVVTWVPPQPPAPTQGWMLLKADELPAVVTSGAAFARKLDPKRNPEAIAASDAYVDATRQSTAERVP
ncbi:MAG TPA: beta-1,6-N-acetylglucosaminyltransferase [Acidimicrobiales bacterium]|nr:beta-1,6-N-acetylglucosaminyltransferase [Acidimicrobiales bacterium]